MTRAQLGPATLTALEADVAKPVLFVQLQLLSSTERLHTRLGDIAWGGNTFTGAGSLASFDGIDEGIELSPYACRMGLSGVDSDIFDLIENRAEYLNRPHIVYLGAIDVDTGALVEDPGIIFSGFIQQIEAVIGGEDGDAVSMRSESELIYFKRSKGLKYSDNQLQAEFAGDLGFQYMDQVPTVTVTWRGKQPPLIYSPGVVINIPGMGERILRPDLQINPF